jgi:hypothetical protein
MNDSESLAHTLGECKYHGVSWNRDTENSLPLRRERVGVGGENETS